MTIIHLFTFLTSAASSSHNFTIGVDESTVIAIMTLLLGTIGALIVYLFKQLVGKMEKVEEKVECLGKKLEESDKENSEDHNRMRLEVSALVGEIKHISYRLEDITEKIEDHEERLDALKRA